MAKKQNEKHDEQKPKPPLWRRQIDTIVETQIARYPYLTQGRAVLKQIETERENRLILVPILLVLFAIFYRNERRKVLAIQRDLED